MSEPPGPDRRTAAEQHIVVPRTARYYTLGDPADAREVWFVLHGYSQLARRFVRHFRPLDDGRRLVVAPEALNRYYSEYAPGYHHPDARIGATWMTREDRLIDIQDYVRYLDLLCQAVLAELPAEPARVTLLGFSQGAVTAARWAARGTARFAEIILWGGLLPPDLPRRPDLFGGAALTLVCGRADHYATPADVQAEADALRAAGIEHRMRWYDGGHQIHADTLVRLAAAP